MEILPKDNFIFNSGYEQFKIALMQLTENEMLVIDVKPNDVKKIRSFIASMAKKFEFKAETSYNKENGKLYISVENIKVRDYNIAIDVLSKYPEMTEIVNNIKRKRNEIL